MTTPWRQTAAGAITRSAIPNTYDEIRLRPLNLNSGGKLRVRQDIALRSIRNARGNPNP